MEIKEELQKALRLSISSNCFCLRVLLLNFLISEMLPLHLHYICCVINKERIYEVLTTKDLGNIHIKRFL